MESNFHIPREVIIEMIAAACHQQNRTYCEMLNDTTQPLWLDAPDWQKDSAIAGVKSALDNPDPEASHKSWLAHKERDGWTHGHVKDPEKKTHPCMMPYGDLPPTQRAKDEYFITMVQQLGRVAGIINSKT